MYRRVSRFPAGGFLTKCTSLRFVTTELVFPPEFWSDIRPSQEVAWARYARYENRVSRLQKNRRAPWRKNLGRIPARRRFDLPLHTSSGFIGRFPIAGSLRSTDATLFLCYWGTPSESRRFSLTYQFCGYGYPHPPRRGEKGLLNCLAHPCYRAVAVPPKGSRHLSQSATIDDAFA